MLKLIAIGTACLCAGAMKFADHASQPPTLADYLAFRCGASELPLRSDPVAHWLSSAPHCWGCVSMAVGAGLLVFAALQLISGYLKSRRAGCFRRS